MRSDPEYEDEEFYDEEEENEEDTEMPLEVQEIVQEIDDDSRHDSFEEQEYNRNSENEVTISSLNPFENNENEFGTDFF